MNDELPIAAVEMGAVAGDGNDNIEKSAAKTMRAQSLLVLTNVKIRREEDIAKEIRWIQDDSHFVCRIYATCHWVINVALTEDDFIKPFEEAVSALPSYVRVKVRVFPGNFNKWIFVQGFIDELIDYDLVLFKDSDIRINSFSWHDFIEKGSSAVVSTPLRRGPNCDDRRQWFQLFEACNYVSSSTPEWASVLYDNVISVEVSFSEQYFALMDAKFANFFFNLALRPSLIQDESMWGLIDQWCHAAKAWDNGRPGCYVVPVVAIHEDSRTIATGQDYFDKGVEAMERYERDPIVGPWSTTSSEWRDLFGHFKDLNEIEQDCRQRMNWNETDSFDLQACSSRVGQLDSQANAGHEVFQRITDELKKLKVIGLNGTSAMDLSVDVKMLGEARSKLEEQLFKIEERK